jgi:hypothetical protein
MYGGGCRFRLSRAQRRCQKNVDIKLIAACSLRFFAGPAPEKLHQNSKKIRDSGKGSIRKLELI